MIASHDFERKVGDVKKHLDKGDVVKVGGDREMLVCCRQPGYHAALAYLARLGLWSAPPSTLFGMLG